jgi:2-polyprenyl-6-methoxyphenol hydroxylase-like FAD-dependent oxidoreductase
MTCLGPSLYSVLVKANFRTIYRNGNTDCDVLVVGAGPTGLTLATALATRRVGVRIIDRLAAGANTSRAAVVHARPLEVLEQCPRIEMRPFRMPHFGCWHTSGLSDGPDHAARGARLNHFRNLLEECNDPNDE